MNRRLFLHLALTASLVALVPLRAAEVRYLQPGRPDALALLPPPPPADSAEQAAELQVVRSVSGARTAGQLDVARSQVHLTIFAFAPVLGPWFKPGALPKTEAFFNQVEKAAKAATNPAKDHWKRTRPYVVDPGLAPVEKEKSFSYPSGHSTRGTVYALVLAELFPDKRDALLDLGRQIGWNRVVGAVHFPSDIYAGRVLGRAIVAELMRSEPFRHDLEEARAEIAAAQASR